MNGNSKNPEMEITITEKIGVDKDGKVSNYEGELTMMKEIEVSDDVIEDLEKSRLNQNETYNDILRRFLGI